MSSSIDEVTCEKCGGMAFREQDNKTWKVTVSCPTCERVDLRKQSLEKLIWNKVPEVMTGGKAYFYNGRGDGMKLFTVIWGRLEKQWKLEQYTRQGELLVGFYKTPKQAMKWADDMYAKHECAE